MIRGRTRTDISSGFRRAPLPIGVHRITGDIWQDDDPVQRLSCGCQLPVRPSVPHRRGHLGRPRQAPRLAPFRSRSPSRFRAAWAGGAPCALRLPMRIASGLRSSRSELRLRSPSPGHIRAAGAVDATCALPSRRRTTSLRRSTHASPCSRPSHNPLGPTTSPSRTLMPGRGGPKGRRTIRARPAGRSGRVVYGSGLENRRGETPRGFESHLLRHWVASA